MLSLFGTTSAVTASRVSGVWAELGELTAAALTPDETAELTRLVTLVADRLARDDAP